MLSKQRSVVSIDERCLPARLLAPHDHRIHEPRTADTALAETAIDDETQSYGVAEAHLPGTPTP